MFQGGVNVSNVLGTAVGVLLLLSAQDIISWDLVWKMILPLMLICIGLSIIFGSNFINNSEEVKKLSKDGLTKYTAVFGFTGTFVSERRVQGERALWRSLAVWI